MVGPNKNSGSREDARQRLAKRQKGRFRRHIRGYFLAGVLVTAPIGITFYISWLLIRWVDSQVTPLLPPAYNPETYLPFAIPGLGLVIVFIVLTFIGWSTAGLLGRLWIRVSEHFLGRMPVIRSVYGAVKQIIETILKQQSTAFRDVVLFEYPRRGSWALGFITGQTQGEVQNLTADDVVNVFLPTTPNPTSGYLLFIPKRELVVLDMTVEEGIKMVVSGGIVTPPDRRPAAEREKKRVAAAHGDTKTVPHKPEADKAAE
ncbi:unnamed protein product [Discosporangium mesarthrocarpum]